MIFCVLSPLLSLGDWKGSFSSTPPTLPTLGLRPSLAFFVSYVFLYIKASDFKCFFFYWSIVALQCCVSFCLQQSDSVIHTETFFFLILFSIMVYPRRLDNSSLCYTVGPCCLSILNVIVCIYQPQTPSPSHSLPPPWQPRVVS